MWQFAEAVRGLADGCRDARHPGHRRQRQLLQPDRRDRRSCPTPVIGVLGVIDDVARRTPQRLRAPTATLIYLLGDTRDEFGGSEWAHVVHGYLGGRPPAVDLAASGCSPTSWSTRSRDGLIDSAHDLSDGGLAQALVESLPAAAAPGARDRAARGRSTRSSRCSASRPAGRSSRCRAAEEVRFTDLCTARGLPHARIGVVDVRSARARGAGPVPRAAARAARRVDRHAAGAVRLTGGSRLIGRTGARAAQGPCR